jgi:hypothetical protein
MRLDDFAKSLDPKGFDAFKRALLSRIVFTVEANVKRVTPVDTGHLRRSITGRVEATGDHGVIGTNVSYARYVHAHTPFLEMGIEDSRSEIARLLEQAGDDYWRSVAR